MGKVKILREDKSYNFGSYFDLPYEVDDILAEFNYILIKSHLALPQTNHELQELPAFKQRIEDCLPFISLSSEAARREILVSPILLEVIRYCHCQMRIEYPLSINNKLHGDLDYFLSLNNNFLVVEAKNNNLTRGFTQLAVELIALSQIQEHHILYGAVTIGNVWQFGKLDSSQQQITQDINLFKVPGDVDNLVSTIIGILEGVNNQ